MVHYSCLVHFEKINVIVTMDPERGRGLKPPYTLEVYVKKRWRMMKKMEKKMKEREIKRKRNRYEHMLPLAYWFENHVRWVGSIHIFWDRAVRTN